MAMHHYTRARRPFGCRRGRASVVLVYMTALVLHSWLRWAVILLGVFVAVRAVSGHRSGRAWIGADAAAGRFYTIALDVQVAVGLALYLWLSPMLTLARADVGAAMGQAAVRFWLVEHLFMMVVALLLAHAGSVRVGRAGSDGERFRRASVYWGLSVLAVVLGSPWPWLAYARPLLRF